MCFCKRQWEASWFLLLPLGARLEQGNFCDWGLSEQAVHLKLRENGELYLLMVKESGIFKAKFMFLSFTVPFPSHSTLTLSSQTPTNNRSTNPGLVTQFLWIHPIVLIILFLLFFLSAVSSVWSYLYSSVPSTSLQHFEKLSISGFFQSSI